ncbi:MAG: hypothetical protein QOJ47_1519, partial [Gaiellales bacterium]|nr:hypothetical protein [Gaiellales bacterium]
AGLALVGAIVATAAIRKPTQHRAPAPAPAAATESA